MKLDERFIHWDTPVAQRAGELARLLMAARLEPDAASRDSTYQQAVNDVRRSIAADDDDLAGALISALTMHAVVSVLNTVDHMADHKLARDERREKALEIINIYATLDGRGLSF